MNIYAMFAQMDKRSMQRRDALENIWPILPDCCTISWRGDSYVTSIGTWTWNDATESWEAQQ